MASENDLEGRLILLLTIPRTSLSTHSGFDNLLHMLQYSADHIVHQKDTPDVPIVFKMITNSLKGVCCGNECSLT